MKKIFLFLFCILCCINLFAQEPVFLPTAKFKTGDNLSWKEKDFDDSDWDNIKTGQAWENEYPNYNGYGWYRFHFQLPLSMLEKSYWKEKLSFDLAMIDDVDETYLNGKLIGKTGSFPEDEAGFVTKYAEYRVYDVSTKDPVILWDKENVLAVRVHDNSGSGGIYQNVPVIHIIDRIDSLFVKSRLEQRKCIVSLKNDAGVTQNGKIQVQIEDIQSSKLVSSRTENVQVKAAGESSQAFDYPDRTKVKIKIVYTDAHTGKIKRDEITPPYIDLSQALPQPQTTASQTIAEMEPWKDAQINGVNREPMRSSFFAYPDAQSAVSGDLNNNPFYRSLNGLWKFNWVKNADMRPEDFYKTDINDTKWNLISVPGLWEMNGYGDPVYVNVGYSWRNHFQNNPPLTPTENNHVGSYRNEIEIPGDWDGKDIFLHFGAVSSNIYLFINGQEVGYSEDSKLEAEFNITKYVKPGKNLIAFQIRRWCDGSYLEDQDFWRMTGIARDVYLYARNKNRLKDIKITADLDDNYLNGILTVKAETTEGVKEIALSLTDIDGKIVAQKTLSGNMSAIINVNNPKKWSAETPYLYRLTATVKDETQVVEAISLNLGFRRSEMKNKQFMINGKPVLIKGVNRHEMNPDKGYYLTRDDMIRDIRLMKELNINAVRTCHYPDDPQWYDLCDEYGIYVVDEANLESHGMRYDDKCLAKNPIYLDAHLERDARMVFRDFNHPSVVVWSMGNEAGNGPAFEKCYNWMKIYDPSRPVQYWFSAETGQSDIYCTMYMHPDECLKYIQTNPQRPLIHCEYSHAMGNSMGAFKDYWDMIRKYPALQGGFIWDFADQALNRYNADGSVTSMYGGTYNRYDASDGTFNCNGILTAARTYHPHTYEVRYQYQSIHTTMPLSKILGTIEIYNENFFKDLSDCYLEWSLLSDGNIVKRGQVWNLNVAPQTQARLNLPINYVQGEILLNVEYKLKETTSLLPAGYVVAYDQLPIRDYDAKAQFAFSDYEDKPILDGDVHYIFVTGKGWKIEFNRRSGFIDRYVFEGRELLEKPFVPQFNRAVVENDMGAGFLGRYNVWRYPQFNLKSLETKEYENNIEVVSTHEIPKTGAKIIIRYLINAVGEIKASEKMIADENRTDVPNLFRYGMTFCLPSRYNVVEFYGRGPFENYADRKSAAMVGHYRQNVDEQYHTGYVRPQESGTHSDMRWLRVIDLSGKGIEIISDGLFSASALPYAMADIDRNTPTSVDFPNDLKKRNVTYVNFELKQMGIGGIDSWGAVPLPKYMIPYDNYTFNFIIRPLKN